jgi:hypothetical protein
MPSGSGKSSFAAMVGEAGKKAHEQHIKDPVASGDLPEGIKGGVAQLKTISASKYENGDNKGKLYVRFGYVVTFPEHTEAGERVAGRQFSENYNMFGRAGKTFGLNFQSVPDTFENRYASFLARLKESFGISEAVTFDQIDQVLAALQSKKPMVRFGTSKATDQGRVFPRVGRDYVAENGEAATGAADSAVEDQTGDQTGDADQGAEPSYGATDGPDLDALDLDGLLELAVTDEGEAARNKILEIADEHGIKDDVESADDWQTGVDLLKATIGANADGDDPAAAAPDPEPFVPKKGVACRYQPVGKDGKPLMVAGKKAKVQEVEIQSSSERGQWVTLKDTTTGKAVVGSDKLPRKVPWAELIHD